MQQRYGSDSRSFRSSSLGEGAACDQNWRGIAGKQKACREETLQRFARFSAPERRGSGGGSLAPDDYWSLAPDDYSRASRNPL